MQRSIFKVTTSADRTDTPLSYPDLTLDTLIIGAGFAGCYILHQLRKSGFNAKIIEAGSDLGGVWYWNSYPGARVDSQWPIYALSIPEVYENWTWSEHYPGHAEIKRYFRFMGEKLDLYRDVVLNETVTAADWNEVTNEWQVRTAGGMLVHARFVIACTGFAAKRYFPDWKGLDTFKGEMHHSSFWPQEGVDVRGKKVAVVGVGATGVQIIQEWAKEVTDKGSLTVFQRTPQLGFPMMQKKITREENEETKVSLNEQFQVRLKNYAGFAYDSEKILKTFDHSAEEREKYYTDLWEKGGFRFHGMNYLDMDTNLEANEEAYRFWAQKVRARIKDPAKRELLAPLKARHILGGKRPSLEQDYYDVLNQANVQIVDIRNNAIEDVVPEGIRTADGVIHEFDTIALATGFDSVSGGLKDISIRGTGKLLRDKWERGIWTYLGMTVSSFPNFFFLYGPQAPTAFANGPSAVEAQADWVVAVLTHMRAEAKVRLEATPAAEQEWKELVNHFSARYLRHHVPSGWNGGNVPGKVQEPLSFAGGLPFYIDKLAEVREDGMRGFMLAGRHQRRWADKHVSTTAMCIECNASQGTPEAPSKPGRGSVSVVGRWQWVWRAFRV